MDGIAWRGTSRDRTLVVDWDGTVTERDTLVMVLAEFGDPDVFDRVSAALDRGDITLNEEIRHQFEVVTEPMERVVSWLLERVRLRSGFREFAAAHRPLVVTVGFRELIEPILDRERIELELQANRVDWTPRGWRPRFRSEEPCSVCGEPCKRSALPTGEIVYVGDGFSDRCAALAADRVFARDGLARYLGSVGAAYEPFEDFHDIAAALG
jgi:2-hydroxy-3-keto-5-methylthiopentenyl-1-phosphate phosphatase